jgi:hypothetical protein
MGAMEAYSAGDSGFSEVYRLPRELDSQRRTCLKPTPAAPSALRSLSARGPQPSAPRNTVRYGRAVAALLRDGVHHRGR